MLQKVAVVMLACIALAGCLEIDLSRTNGNQKDDGVETVE